MKLKDLFILVQIENCAYEGSQNICIMKNSVCTLEFLLLLQKKYLLISYFHKLFKAPLYSSH